MVKIVNSAIVNIGARLQAMPLDGIFTIPSTMRDHISALAGAAINADMAIRLSQWLGGNSEIWLRQQLQYDLWHAEQASLVTAEPAKREIAA